MRAFTAPLIALVATISAHAAQDVFVTDGARILVSPDSLNVLVVENGRVAGVVAADGDLVIKEQGGSVYFRLSDPLSSVPLFVEAERNGEIVIYSLMLDPGDAGSPPERVVIRDPDPPQVSPSSVSGIESADNRARAVKALVLAMTAGDQPEGFDVSVPSGAPTPGSIAGVEVDVLAVYSGSALEGQVLSVLNSSGSPIELDERNFYDTRAVASVAFEVRRLQPGESSLVFIVRQVRG